MKRRGRWRRALRRVTERVLGSLVIRRRLPAEAGGAWLFVNAQSGGLKFIFRSSDRFDQELLWAARVLIGQGSQIWDVGANVGLFASAAAYHAGPTGRVIALEPDVDVARLLLRTAGHQSSTHAPLVVLPVAAAGACGTVRFGIANRARAANAIEGYGSSQTGGIRETRLVPTLTLDALLRDFAPPDVVKIDVEGAELSVLRGAKRVLREARPRLYLEVSPQRPQDVWELLTKFSYEVFDGEGVRRVEPTKWGPMPRNIIAVPTDGDALTFTVQ